MVFRFSSAVEPIHFESFHTDVTYFTFAASTFQEPTSKPMPRKPILIAAIALLASAIFALDLLLPLGVAGGVPYVAVVLLGWWLGGRWPVIAIAITCSLLTAAGFFFSPEGGIPWVVLTNRQLALFAIWVGAILVLVAKSQQSKSNRLTKERDGIMDDAQIGIALTKNRKIVHANKYFGMIVGWASEETLGGDSERFFPDREAFERFEDEAHPLVEHGEAYDKEVLVQHKDGTRLWCRVVGRAVDPTDISKGVIWITEDITRRKNAETETDHYKAELEQLLQSRTMELDSVLDSADIGIALVKDRKAVRVNRKFEELFGGPAEDFIGHDSKNWHVTPESHEELVRTAYPILAAGGVYESESEFRRQDGTTFLCRKIAKAIDPDDPSKGNVWLSEDITERRRMEKALQESEERFRGAFEHSSVGMAIIDRSTLGYLRTNQALSDITGYSAEELKEIDPRTLVHPLDHDSAIDAIETVARGEKSNYALERRYLTKNGKMIWCDVNASSLRGADGSPVGIIILLQDITERKEAEAALTKTTTDINVIMDNADIGIVFTKDRRIVRANKFNETLFGWKEEDWVQDPSQHSPIDTDTWDRVGEDAYLTI